MRLPRRIADILKRKQDFIDSQRMILERSVIRAQNEMFTRIVSELIPSLDIVDGVIQESAKNYRLVSMLDKVYRDFQKQNTGIFIEKIQTGTDNIGAMSVRYFKAMYRTDIPERFARVIEKTNKLMNLRIGLDGGRLVRGGFLDSFFNSPQIGLDLKQMTSKAITSGTGMREYVRMLKDMITGVDEKAGALERQFQRYAYDLYQQYDRAYGNMMADELELTYFVYNGGLINDSRDFCAAHDGKVWTREDSEWWPEWTPSKGEYPEGYEIKQKDIYAVPSYLGYPGYSPLVDFGGYNCRHHPGWISDELAKKMRPDIE